MTQAGDRRRFLFAMFQGGGNIPLILPIVSELMRRGHQVRVIAGPNIRGPERPLSPAFLERIRASGAELVDFEMPTGDPYNTGPSARGLAFGWMPERFSPVSERMARTTLWSASWAANVVTELERSPADVLVCDYWLFGAIAAGEAAHIPTGVIVHNAFPWKASGHPPKTSGYAPPKGPVDALGQLYYRWAYDRIWKRDGLPAHNAARRTLGLPAIDSPFGEYDRAARVLILGYESFDFPARELNPNIRYVGTPIDDADVAPDAWISPWPRDDPRPLVLVSMSTLPQGQGAAMRNVIAAVGTMPVRALVTLGPSLNADDFAAPANAVFETFVPHSAVLPYASAIISQCGLSTLSKALRHGVPLVCMPIVGDQPDNAVRIVAKGAGVRLSPDASPEEIERALTRVLTDPSFREGAARLGAQMVGDRAEQRAADELEGIVHTPSHTTANGSRS
jgi:UDP:flavonoid glycosyltransferase YjiC (YdhE family)